MNIAIDQLMSELMALAAGATSWLASRSRVNRRVTRDILLVSGDESKPHRKWWYRLGGSDWRLVMFIGFLHFLLRILISLFHPLFHCRKSRVDAKSAARMLSHQGMRGPSAVIATRCHTPRLRSFAKRSSHDALLEPARRLWCRVTPP